MSNNEESENQLVDVCQDQVTFNHAFKNAVHAYNKSYMEENQTYLTVVMIVWLLLTVWAVMLAARIRDPNERIEHIIFAVLFPPLYIVAYYFVQ